MKKFFKIIGFILLAVIALLYLAFLFVLPRVVDLSIYKPEIQKIVQEQTGLKLDYGDVKIVTTPMLAAGIETDNISVKLPDDSVLFSADAFRGRIALPSLFLLTVKVSCAEIDAPTINLDIAEGKQFKIVTLIENLLNAESDDKIASVEPSEEPVINPELIRIKVPAIKLNNYKAVINDLKAGHNLTLLGDKLVIGYFNGKVLKVKTDAKLLSDDNTNIVAKVDINTFIPPASKLDEEDDRAQRVEIPFVNPVEMYRDYNLKSNIDTKLKIRQYNEDISLKGYLNVDNVTMNLSGYQLPECYLHYVFNGPSVDMDTNLYVAKNQNIRVSGSVNYSSKPAFDLKILTDKIYFNDVIILTKAVLDTLHIPNEVSSLKGQGYFTANTNIKTDFKKLKSSGSIVARNGAVLNSKTGVVFKGINANILLDNNMLRITDTRALINGETLNVQGSINKDSVIYLSVLAEKLPLPGLFLAFAPRELKNAYNLSSGDLFLDAKMAGELKESSAILNLGISNFAIAEKNNSFRVANGKLTAEFISDFKDVRGKIKNKGFSFTIPQTNSVISDELLVVDINNNNVNVLPTKIKINKNSKVIFKGSVEDYTKKPLIDLFADGKLFADDLKQFAGREAAFLLDAKGIIPLKFSFKGDDKRQSLICQIFSDYSNYITPVNFKSLVGKQSIIQTKVDFKGDRLKVKDTGLFTNAYPVAVTDDLDLNLNEAKEIVKISGTVTGLNGPIQNINLFKIIIPEELEGDLFAFKNSTFKAGGNLYVFGDSSNPRMRGHFKVKELAIPDLFLTLDEATARFKGHNLNVDVNELLVNGSDMRIKLYTSLVPSSIFTISHLNFASNIINVDKLLQVSEAAMKIIPQSPQSATSSPADIPVIIRSGSIDIKQIISGNIEALNTTSRLALRRNTFFINNLRTRALDGTVTGNISTNLLSGALKVVVRGYDFDVEKTLLVLANMKDTLSGTLAFNTDISLSGATMEEQMKSLQGQVNFIIREGTLGPFGKIENFILAENIRESKFFQTALGGMINSLTSIDTAHYNILTGHLEFNDGIASINPIVSIGNILSLHIAGDMNLLENTADMKVRARLASQVSDMLGPISNLNPINLVKATPGLNVAAAQMFKIFCESVSQEEMDAVPSLGASDDNATKFQIVLKGDVAKPLSLVKSFKWLALDSDIENASAFVSTLPDPSMMENPETATLEEILQKQAELAELQAIEDAKLKNRVKRFIKKFSNKENLEQI